MKLLYGQIQKQKVSDQWKNPKNLIAGGCGKEYCVTFKCPI